MFFLRCAELGLTLDVLDVLTMGDVYDMLTEKMNDLEDYPKAATQEDIKTFFR